MLKIVILTLGAGALALFVIALVLVRRLDTPEFRKELLARVELALGTKVRVAKMDLALLSGVELEGVRIANPPPFSGDLLTAETFSFR